MSRPALWLCEKCRRPLGQVVDGDLDVFGPSKTQPGGLKVPCVCGTTRVWYSRPDPERDRLAEFARTSF